MICDFCSIANPKWHYKARSFTADRVFNLQSGASLDFNSYGNWAACDVCHDLIEKNDRARLLERCVSRFIELYPEVALSREALRNDLGRIHKGFFEHRIDN